MTYTEFIIEIENNIAKANCDKLNIREYEKEQKRIFNQIRADVIDEFAKALITMYERYDIDIVFESSDTYSYTNACCIFEDYIKEIAEELKAGVEE